jgi:TPR repeat protein
MRINLLVLFRIFGLFAFSSLLIGCKPKPDVTPSRRVAERDISSLIKLAEEGSVQDQLSLGHIYSLGKDMSGATRDYAEAFKWFRKAAEQGSAKGQYYLGRMYYYGEGTPKDYAEAAKFYRKAAEQGDVLAQFNLGICYASGEGVAKDAVDAYAYYSLAGVADEHALKNLAILETRMSPDQIAAGKKRTIELQKEIEAKKAAKKAGK